MEVDLKKWIVGGEGGGDVLWTELLWLGLGTGGGNILTGWGTELLGNGAAPCSYRQPLRRGAAGWPISVSFTNVGLRMWFLSLCEWDLRSSRMLWNVVWCLSTSRDNLLLPPSSIKQSKVSSSALVREHGADRLSWNVRSRLPVNAAQRPRRTDTSRLKISTPSVFFNPAGEKSSLPTGSLSLHDPRATEFSPETFRSLGHADIMCLYWFCLKKNMLFCCVRAHALCKVVLGWSTHI